MNTPSMFQFPRFALLLILLCFFHSTAQASLTVGTIDTTNYGNYFNGVTTHPEFVELEFQQYAGDLTLTVDGYDIDSANENEVFLNGVSIGNLTPTGDLQLGESTFSISAAAQVSGTNTLRFEQLGYGWAWGVTNILLSVGGSTTPSLVIDVTNTNTYGYAFANTYTNPLEAEFEFQQFNGDLMLSVTGYDIDSASENKILLNGVQIGNLTPTGNNSSGTTQILIDASQQVAGTNTLTFQQLASGWIWGVTDILLSSALAKPQLIVGTTHTDVYGFHHQGVLNHPSKVEFEFQQHTGDLDLSVTGFDIDSTNENQVFVNDISIGHLTPTGDLSSGSSNLTISSSHQIAGSNTLRFQQLGSGWVWGVTDILLEEASLPQLVVGTTHQGVYGNHFQGVFDHPSMIELEFEQHGSDLELSVLGFDIDSTTENQVFLNDVSIGHLLPTGDLSTGTTTLTITAAQQQSDTNTLRFQQLGSGWIWGVTDILLSDATPPPSPVDLSLYSTVFSDEFNSTTLNNQWATSHLWGPFVPTNAEEQYYVDISNSDTGFAWSPFELNGSTLSINATPTTGALQAPAQPIQTADYWTDNPEYQFNENYDPASVGYLSGVLASYKTFSFTHGYAEARLKVPAGKGLWPAFWLHTFKFVEDVPEIDIMEHIGEPADEVYHTAHYFDIANNWQLISSPTHKESDHDYTAGFHTYSVSWEPKQIIFFIDGVETHRLTSENFTIPKQAMHVILNLAVGGNWPGSPNANTVFPAKFEIDYVRVYQKNAPALITPAVLASQYELMFEEEFSGNTLDANKWSTHYLWGPFLRINQEEQYYMDIFGWNQGSSASPFTVSNDTLKITASAASPAEIPDQPDINDPMWTTYPWHQRNEDFKQPAGWTPNYISGLITSYDSFKLVHGYIEGRMKIPEGSGLWPAFWLLNGYYVGPQPEIDIMEAQGETPDVIHHSYHYSNTVGQLVSSAETTTHPNSASGASYADGFHTYGVEWHPGEINWYLDGQIVRTLTGPEVSLQLEYIIANLAVGGNFVGAVDPAALPATLEIDYIRAWQLR